jgi:hypothetical protein
VISPTEPSQTALTAAAARAAHLVVDASPFIFADVVAAALLGDRPHPRDGHRAAGLTRAAARAPGAGGFTGWPNPNAAASGRENGPRGVMVNERDTAPSG